MTPKNSTPNLSVPTHKLITLFTSDEYDNLYKAPQFTNDERSYFLTFSAGDLQLAQSCTKFNDKIYCLLCLGYFRAKRSLIQFAFDEVPDDCSYVIKMYFNEHETSLCIPPTHTQIRIHNKILKHEHALRWKTEHQAIIHPLLMELIKRHPKARPLTKTLLHHLSERNIALPAYSTLQRLISYALNMLYVKAC